MPAKKLAGGVDPVENSQSTSNKFPFTPKQWFSDRLLLLVVVIFLLVLLFVVGFAGVNYYNDQVSNQLTQQQKVDFTAGKQLQFVYAYNKERFEQLLNLAFNSSERTQAADSLGKAFSVLSLEYGLKPNKEMRSAMVNILQYIQKNFPEQSSNFSVPCFEESCGGLNYSDELKDIKSLVENNASIDQTTRLTVLSNLNNVALASGSDDKRAEFNGLSAVFQGLKCLWQENKDAGVAKIAEQILILMRKIDPESYQFGVQRGLFTL